MGFQNYREINEAISNGQTSLFSWRKAPTQTTATNIWFDLSMSPGNPVPNYYAATPLISKRLAQSTDGGIFHGGNATNSKHVKSFTALCTTPTTAVPLPIIVCDYLLYYPFIDMSTTDTQNLTTSETLSRYTDGEGVQIMAIEVASQIGGVQFYVTYTNSDGVAGRVTPNIRCNSQISVGTLITTAAATAGCAGPFLPLQGDDKGVRSIESVTFLSADVGLITLVLVKPLFNNTIVDIQAPAERDFTTDFLGLLPEIKNDAYLNMICLPSGTLASGQILGLLETVWI